MTFGRLGLFLGPKLPLVKPTPRTVSNLLSFSFQIGINLAVAHWYVTHDKKNPPEQKPDTDFASPAMKMR